MRGRVKWYNDVKGYGFIEQSDGEDVFVHYSVIEVEGFRALIDDQEVDYECSEGPKGLQATKVVPV
jgi:cold shock protein